MSCGMCAPSPAQIGEPLTREVLDGMPLPVREFWEDFLTQARTELDANEAEEAMPPYAPTADLAAKYQRAVGEFKGGIYCPVRQLEGLFAFKVG